MSTIPSMETRRSRALAEQREILALQQSRALLPYEERMLRKLAELIEDMDRKLAAAAVARPA